MSCQVWSSLLLSIVFHVPAAQTTTKTRDDREIITEATKTRDIILNHCLYQYKAELILICFSVYEIG